MNFPGITATREYTQNFLRGLQNYEVREYQVETIAETVHYFLNEGIKSLLIESPVASGKTGMFLITAKILQEITGCSAGIVSHRSNLLNQAYAEDAAFGIGLKAEYISMYCKNPPQADLLLVDESHHDSTDSMAHIHNTVRPKWILGVTATPFRTDRVKLCFDKVLKKCGIHYLIKEGYLSQYQLWNIPQWNPSAVAAIYLNERKKWGKSLMFFHTLQQSHEAAQLLKRGGVRAVDITQSNKEEVLRDFSAGKVSVVTNCMLLTEGFNMPDLETVFARPSCKSLTIQMCGRVFRKNPAKPGALKNIVQSDDSKWPFIKTAMPKYQHKWQPTGADEREGPETVGFRWISLTPNENINSAANNVVRTLANITVKLPDYFKTMQIKQQTSTRRRRVGGGRNDS